MAAALPPRTRLLASAAGGAVHALELPLFALDAAAAAADLEAADVDVAGPALALKARCATIG